MKKLLLAGGVLLFAFRSPAPNITNYPVVTFIKPTDWFFLSSVPDATNRNTTLASIVANINTNGGLNSAALGSPATLTNVNNQVVNGTPSTYLYPNAQAAITVNNTNVILNDSTGTKQAILSASGLALTAGSLTDSSLTANVALLNRNGQAFTGSNSLQSVSATNYYTPSNNAAVTDMSISGSLISYPQYPSWDTRLAANHGDSHGGDGTEYQLVYNRVAIVPVSGSVLQIGNGGDFSLGVLLNGMAIPANQMGKSATLDFLYQYHPSVNTNLNWSGKWDIQATNYNTTTGNSTLDFWVVTTNQNFNTDGGDLTYSSNNVMSLDSAGFLRLKGAITRTLTSTSPSSTYTINFGPGVTDWNSLNLVTATTFSLGGLPLTNMQQAVDLMIYPGLSQKSVTMPASVLWESESGLAIAPTNIPASNVMHLTLNAVYGGITNVFAHYSLAPYTPVLDTNASNFFTTFGVVNATEKDAANNLVLELKNGGIYTAYDAIYPFLGSSSNIAKGNLQNTGGTNNYTIVWNGAPSAFTFDGFGVSGDGSTSFGDTGFKPSTASSPNFVLNSAGIICYSKFNPGFNGGVGNAMMGWGSGGGNNICSFWTTAGSATVATAESFRGPNDLSSTTITYGNGFHMMNRTSSTAITYVSGSTSQTISSASVAVNTQNGYVLGNNDGGLGRSSTNRLAFAAIRRGFSATELTTESNAFTHFVTALGRQ